eukprot:Gb_16898 [translate_table: standard]
MQRQFMVGRLSISNRRCKHISASATCPEVKNQHGGSTDSLGFNTLGVLRKLKKHNSINLRVNSKVYASLLRDHSKSQSIAEGRHVHAYIIKIDFEPDIFLGNNLISMYVKCRSLRDGRQVFDRMPERNVVTWTAIIAGYVQNGHGDEALKLFNQMQLDGLKPDHFTFACVFNACASLTALEQGKIIHDRILGTHFESNVVVGSAIIDMYSKCGGIEEARQVFNKLCKRNVVTWTAMIAAYAKNGFGDDALKLFSQMQQQHNRSVKPNYFTFSSALSACASLASLEQGKQVHTHITIAGLQSEVVLGSALVDMYAKCGRIENARQLFDKMPKRNTVSWNVMIAGCAQHGRGKEALQIFEQMLLACIEPDEITFVGVLSACSHAGLVDEGHFYFDFMSQKHGIIPKVEHYACMVDLLGRAGCLEEAVEFINTMPIEPNFAVWGALLGACRIHGNMEIGKRAAEYLLERKQQVGLTYVLMSNIYAAAGKWDDVTRVRKIMKDRGVNKQPGCSWIEVNKKMHTFVVGDRLHPQKEEIYGMLESLADQLREAGYVPDTNLEKHDPED